MSDTNMADTDMNHVRRIIYREIADHLRTDIESGHYAAGGLLPSESELCANFDASRVTIRKSLELLRGEGLITSRQGFGWTVASEPLTQSLDSLISIERQLAAAGRIIERHVVSFGFAQAPPVASVLGERVLEVGRLNVVDDSPFSRIVVWCREDLAADISRSQVTDTSFLDLLSDHLSRAVQTIAAQPMPNAEADLLGVEPGSAALRVTRVAYAQDSVPLFVSEHWFPGHLTEFVAELSANGHRENELRLTLGANPA